MSQENVEIVGRMYDAYSRGDFETSLSHFGPEVEWDLSAYPLPDWPNTGRGRENFARHLADYLSGWREYRAEPREMIDAGDMVLVVLYETAVMRGSDARLERDLHQVWTLSDGVIVHLGVFKTRAQALEAAGLPE
jgi:ketosteroid isomerase-like protein